MFLFRTEQKPDPQATISKLADRLANATLLEDRKAAVLGLKGLSRDYTLAVGTCGLQPLMKALKIDKQDVDMVKSTLETIHILCTVQDRKAKDDLGLMFSEIFIKDPTNVALMLDLLEEMDFYVRFQVVQLMSTLLENMPGPLQDAILVSPMGVSRLIDLLDDKREIIRNEGLLLLMSLSKTNAEIQKIVAFENAFDKLLGIIFEEGGVDGGIVVQDCLQLMLHLLRYNVSNQKLFRENSCIQKIPFMLRTKIAAGDKVNFLEVSLTHESSQWKNDQKISNVTHVLELCRILVAPNNSNTPGNQTAMFQAKLIPVLLDLALCSKVPIKVRALTLYALGDIVRSNQELQNFVFQYHQLSEKMGAWLSLFAIAFSKEHYSLRFAATSVIVNCLEGHMDYQVTLAEQMFSLEATAAAGQMVMGALLDLQEKKDPYRCWLASSIVIHAIKDNQKAKETLLASKIDEGLGDDNVPFIHKLTYTLLTASRDGMDVRFLCGLLSVLCVWMFEHSSAIKEFLSEGSNIQFLVEQTIQSSGVHVGVQGLSAFLLGLCYLYNDDSEPSFTKTTVHSLISSRVGFDVYFNRLDRFKELPEFTKVTPYYTTDLNAIDQLPAGTYPDILFDQIMVDLFQSQYGNIESLILKDVLKTGLTKPNKPAAIRKSTESTEDSAHKQLIRKKDEEISQLKKELLGLQPNMEALNKQIQELIAENENLKNALKVQETKYAELEQEQEDLLVCLAEQDEEMKGYKDRLRAHGEIIEDEEDIL